MLSIQSFKIDQRPKRGGANVREIQGLRSPSLDVRDATHALVKRRHSFSLKTGTAVTTSRTSAAGHNYQSNIMKNQFSPSLDEMGHM